MRDDSGPYDVEPMGNGEYRIRGISEGRLRTALTLLSAADHVRGANADARRDQLVRAMIIADFDPVPAATVSQARRLAEHRGKLLASGAFTMAALTQLRGATSESSTRTWLTRRRHAHELFTVTHDAATLVPAFQFGEGGEPITGLRPVLTALDDAGLESWAVWTWFTATNSWLGGRRPVDVDLERAATAARRLAANAA